MNTIVPSRTPTVDSDRRCSPSIWGDCPWEDIVNPRSPVDGVYIADDFAQGGLITSPTTEAALVGIPYSGFGSSGATITHGDAQGGTVVLTEATDNEAVYMKAETHPFQLSSALGKFWFEARVKVSAITDNQIGFILGLMDTTAMTVIVPLSTTNPPVLSACNFVGFWGPEEDAGSVNSSYIADGVTPVDLQEGVHQFVADTYVKLGMKVKSDGRLYFYVNGVEQTTSKLLPNATGTDFPADVRLAPIVGHRLGAGTSSLTTIDWWYGAQLI
jgi:hypothetical protein